MSKAAVTMHPVAGEALHLLANMIRIARTERRMSRSELAKRARCSPATIAAVESGSPGCAIGTVFACCAILEIPLFTPSEADLRHLRRSSDHVVALLPQRAVPRKVDNDF